MTHSHSTPMQHNATPDADCGAFSIASPRNRREGRPRRAAFPILESGMEYLEQRSMMAVAPLIVGVEPLDGVGNNLVHPEWGSTGEQFLRRSPSAYADGASSPSGADRPNARQISNIVFPDLPGGVTNDRDMSGFVYAWGQFLDHDLTLSDSASPAETFSIAIPAGDRWFDPSGTGTQTMPNLRTAYDPTTGTTSPREQVNSLTAFIDGSQIYGSDAQRAAALREFAGGRLRTSAGNLLPFNTAGLPNATIGLTPDDKLYLAGDVRANENPQLLAMHTLFVREHNRIAAQAAVRNPSWSDEQLFQHARRIVIAELQDITYNEFLPALLGGGTPAAAAMQAYRGYRADVNPGIANEFATAAYRFGHSLLNAEVGFIDDVGAEVRSPLGLRDSFFNVTVVGQTGIDPILKYLASDRAQEVDARVIDDVRNFLFGAPGQGGFDLAALNIQRGRDHGIADYNTVRVAYGLPRLKSFAEITPDTSVQQALRQAYGSVDTVDMWVGGLAEKHLPGSSLGATFTRIIVDQFARLRDGDRFWYQNVLPAAVVRDIQKTSLADIVRRNTQLTNLQPDLFLFRTEIAGTIFADGNRDGSRQANEAGIAGAPVTLIDAAGSTVAVTRSNARGEYVFHGIDLGTFRVVVSSVTAPAGSTTASRPISITRGMEVRGIDLAAPKPTTTAPKPPATPRPTQPRQTPPTLDPRTVAFASMDLQSVGGNTRVGITPAGRKP